MLACCSSFIHTHTHISSWASTQLKHHDLLLLSCLKSTDYNITDVHEGLRVSQLVHMQWRSEAVSYKQSLRTLRTGEDRRRTEENREGWTPWSRTFHPWGHWSQTHILKLLCVSAAFKNTSDQYKKTHFTSGHTQPGQDTSPRKKRERERAKAREKRVLEGRFIQLVANPRRAWMCRTKPFKLY